tara:strand:- start:1299 stop:3122 length:1824 start_codon:yes stop_codon:yes gene_type:complete
MASFTNAQVLGISASSQFLGDRTARLRTVKSIEIEGFIDSRSNTDLQGVSETQSTIDTLVSSLNSPSTVTEEILVNSINFGTGKIVSVNFPAAAGGAKENQILVGNYSASLEIYDSGDIAALNEATDDLSIPNTNFLEEFSENFSASRGDDDVYEFSHDLSLRYISGLQPDGGVGTEIINPISAAKTLAQSVFNQTLTSFNFILGGAGYDYDSVAKKYFNETYDLENGTASYQKRFSLFKTDGTTYSAQITNALEMGEDGIIKVTENGEIQGRANDQSTLIARAKAGANTEIANSFTRCSTAYTAYKSYLSTPASLPWLNANSSTLRNQSLSTSKTINANNGTVSYSVEYTDDKNIESVSLIKDRTIDFSKNGDICSVSEKGTITAVGVSKGGPATISASLSNLPSISDVKTRCTNVYTKNRQTGTLKKVKASSSFAGVTHEPNSGSNLGGKTLEYTYDFTDDPEVFEAGTFSRKKVKSNDSMGVVNTKILSFPNQPNNISLVHFPNQTSPSTRTVSAESLMRRDQTGSNNIISYRDFQPAAKELFNDMLLEGMNFLVDNPSFTTIDDSQVFVTDLSFSFDSTNTLNGSVTFTFIGTRQPPDMRKIL